jgi:hypothetical protein
MIHVRKESPPVNKRFRSRPVPSSGNSFADTAHEHHPENKGRGLRSAPASSESLNHSATVNPKLRESHCLLGRQRVSGRDDLEMFGRRDGNPDFRAVLTPDCRPPATGLALVSVDNVRLINDRHESCFSARDSNVGASDVHIYTRSQDVAGSLARASPAVARIAGPMTARKSDPHQRLSLPPIGLLDF